jgi:hypothetical protein
MEGTGWEGDLEELRGAARTAGRGCAPGRRPWDCTRTR